MSRGILSGLLLFLSCLLAFAQTGPNEDCPKTTPAPEGRVAVCGAEIGTGGGRLLHAELAFPENPPREPMPAIIWIHGGGWSKGSHKRNVAEWLAKHGYFVASIEYRLTSEAIWPAQIEDCKLAVRWLRANAVKYHVCPDRIGAWGASAGGHLAVFLGTTDDPKFEGKGGYEGVSSRVQAVVDFCGPVDFTEGSAGIQKPLAKPPDYEAPALCGLFGASFKEKPDLWREGSPICYVKPGAPPFLIVHGDKDFQVPYEQSDRLRAALEQANVPVKLITVRNGVHGGGRGAINGLSPNALPDPAPREVNAAILEFLNKYLKQ